MSLILLSVIFLCFLLIVILLSVVILKVMAPFGGKALVGTQNGAI
jgi:hypothetical protein